MNASLSLSSSHSASVSAYSGLARACQSEKIKYLAEFQQLFQLASVNHVDITAQRAKICKILKSDDKQPAAAIRLLYEIAILQKCNEEINQKIIRYQNQIYLRSSDASVEWKKQMLRFQHLVERAHDSHVDVSAQDMSMQDIRKTRISSDEPHQFQSIRDLYEAKMLQKYNREIAQKLEFCRLIRRATAYHIQLSTEEKALSEALNTRNLKKSDHQFKSMENLAEINQNLADRITHHLQYLLFHVHSERYLDAECNSDFQWKKQMAEFLKLLQIAKEKQIDISEQSRKMELVLLDQPEASTHQFTPITVLYEIQMLKKYNQEIARKIIQHGLFHANQECLKDYFEDQTSDVISKFQEWVERAQQSGLDVSNIVARIEHMENDLKLVSTSAHQMSSVRLLSANEMRKMYCIRIIRQMAEAEIHKWAVEGRENSSLKKHSLLINRSEKFLLKQLPHEDNTKTIQEGENKYHFIMNEMERMMKSIHSRNR